MLDIVKVTSVLKLLFTFNNSEDKNSLELEESKYNDSYFRWTKNTFKHKQKLTAIYSDNRIDVFNTEKVKDRLHSNKTKIKYDKEKINFGCNFSIVRDLVYSIEASEITEGELNDYNRNKIELIKISENKKKKNVTIPIQNTKRTQYDY